MKKHLSTSVIIPAYNEDYYLQRCLRALSSQSVSIDQIIVVDNNSSDDSIKMAKSEFPKVTFLEEKKQGIVYARNKGFANASGDILIKIDADSIVDQDWHEMILEDFQKYNCDAWSGYAYCEEVNPAFRKAAEAITNTLTFAGMRIISGQKPLFGSNMAMTKETWEKIKPNLLMRNDIWEDLDMALNVGKNQLSVVTNRSKRLKISSRSANVKASNFYRRLFGQSRVYLLHKKWFSFGASLILMHISFATWLLGWPLTKIGQLVATRPRLDQY